MAGRDKASGALVNTDVPEERGRHTACFNMRVRSFSMTAEVRISSGGLLAIGALTSSILLSTAVLVWSATNVARRRAKRAP